MSELTPELKKKIDEMPLEEMLSLNRFAPVGYPMFQRPSGDYFMEVMRKKRAVDPEGWTHNSKRLGW